MSKQTLNLNFQDPSGQPIDGGYVVFRLSVDISAAASTGPQVVAGRVTSATLDNNGSCTVSLWPNDVMFPSGSDYFVEAFTAKGLPVWQGELTVTSIDYLLQEDGISTFLLETSNVDSILLEN